MTEEQKATLEAEEAAAKADATDEQPAEGEGQPEPDEESQQLEAELKREREAREKAEKALAEDRYKFSEKKRKEEEEVAEEEDKPLTAKQLQAVLAKEREATRKELLAGEADRIASTISGSDTEKQLILEIHKNRSFPAHLSLEEQIEECYILANKKKILGENSELKRALKGRQGVSKDSSTTHQDSPASTQPKLHAGDNAELARVGFKWNGTNRQFEKKLPNGKVLIFDPKTKETRLA